MTVVSERLHAEQTLGIAVSRGLLGLAAGLWLASAFLVPSTRGVGASLSSHQLADLVGSGALGGLVPRALGPLWYLTPLGAALVLGTLGLPGTPARAIRALAALIACACATSFAVSLTHLRPTRLGPGSWCALAASALALVALVLERSLLPRTERIQGVL